MTTIDITVDDDAVSSALGRLQQRASDLSPAMAVVASLLRESAEESFERQAASDGTPWAPLAPATAARKARKGYSPLALVRDGYLRSLTALSTPTTAVAGTNLIYAATHQFGHEHDNLFGRGIEATIPARPFLGLRRDYVDDIVDVIIQHLTA